MRRWLARRPLAAAICSVAALWAVPAAARAVPAPSLSVRAAALVDESTGQQLYGVAADQQLAIASATKLMTALLTLEQVRRLGTTFTQNDYRPASGDSQVGLVPGEQMSVHDLLLALLLPSADDAAEDLAYNVGHGSVAHFIAMMNERARELGLTHTHYSTPIGFDTPGNYSSASDLVDLARFLLLHHRFFAHAVAMPSALVRLGGSVVRIANRNDLVGAVPWINGAKTGHTLDAGYVLVGSGTRGGVTLISAVLGTSSQSARDSNTLALLNYGFANFHRVTPVIAGSVLARPTVRDQPGLRAPVITARTFTDVVPRTARVTLRVELPRQLAGPLPLHADVGTAVVVLDGAALARIPLLLARRLGAVSPLTLATRFITRPFTLVVLVLLLFAALGLVVLRRVRARGADVAGPEPA